MAKKIKLYDVAHSRAGDKGEITVVSLFSYNESDYELLEERVTPEIVKKHFEGLVSGEVTRYEVPSIKGFNFVLYGTRPGGVASALDLDAHGKSFSSALLELEIDL